MRNENIKLYTLIIDVLEKNTNMPFNHETVNKTFGFGDKTA